MKMKLKKAWMVVFLLSSYGCGYQVPTEQDLQNVALEEDDGFLLGEDGEYAEDFEVGEGAEGDDSVDQESANEIMLTIRSLHKQTRKEVAECVGLSEELAAFESQKQALIDSGANRKAIKDSLKEEHKALRDKFRADEDLFQTCRDAAKEGDYGLAIKNIIEKCWDKPEDAEDEGFTLRRKGGGRHYGMRGKMKHGPKLPPKEFAAFEAEICKEAVAEAGALVTTED